MLGTETSPSRCKALAGDVGGTTACSIYALRPTPCREFAASWEFGEINEACDRARVRHGLLPLRPEDWLGDEPNAPLPSLPHRRIAS